MKDRLWKDIQTIYEHYMKKRCENLNIISLDNFYIIKHHNDKINIYIKIQKEYNLINLWNDGKGPYQTYTIEGSIQYINLGTTISIQEENRCIEQAYSVLNPYLREVKLTTLGI